MIVCVNCGAYLDPNEKCDCEEAEALSLRRVQKKLMLAQKNREMYETAQEEWKYV